MEARKCKYIFPILKKKIVFPPCFGVIQTFIVFLEIVFQNHVFSLIILLSGDLIAS